MNKVLLINPRFGRSVEYDTFDSVPLGLLYVGSWLKKYSDFDVEFVDCLYEKDYEKKIKSGMQSAMCVGLSVMSTQIPNALKITDFVKETDKDLPIAWGGVHGTLFAEQTCENEKIDYLVRGEGEETFRRLATALKDGGSLKDIGGLTYREGERIVSTPKQEDIDLNKLPLVDWDLMNPDFLKKLTLTPAHTSRGCSHRCTFCINPILHCGWRGRDPKIVLDEVQDAAERFPGKKVRFWDENFFFSMKRSKEIIDGIIERGLDIEWETTVRADYFKPKKVDDELLPLMKKSGCYKLSFGAESGSQKILDMLKKDVTVDELVYSAQQCSRYDIIPEYSFMTGLPDELYEDTKMTIELMDRLRQASKRVEFIGPQPFRPYPGSPLYNRCLEFGWKAPDSLGKWSELMENQYNYLSPKNFPWIKDPDTIEYLWPYLHYALTDTKTALSSGAKVGKLLKMLFIAAAKTRWKLRYFKHPIEYKLYKRFF